MLARSIAARVAAHLALRRDDRGGRPAGGRNGRGIGSSSVGVFVEELGTCSRYPFRNEAKPPGTERSRFSSTRRWDSWYPPIPTEAAPMRSADLLHDNDWRVFILGGAGQSRPIAEGVVCSRSADERAEVSTSCRSFSSWASRQEYARQPCHAAAVANHAGARRHAQAPACASLEPASALLAPRRTGSQPPSPSPSWTASHTVHSRRHGP